MIDYSLSKMLGEGFDVVVDIRSCVHKIYRSNEHLQNPIHIILSLQYITSDKSKNENTLRRFMMDSLC